MPEIIELDEILSNKIAAGEVVERPASVVKELVENAIDAESTIIEIDVEEAGLNKIRVIDNGKGIDESDAILAFRRHATSKIKDEHDLFRIRTLGFRGEALPSIASVSKVELISAKEGQPGTRVVLEGGNLITHELAQGRKGTDITVSELFYNTPARLKYLKTIHTEIGHISDIVNRLALANPSVSFRLRHNGRTLLSTNGNGDIRQVIAAIYGTSIAKQMLQIKGESLDFSLTGYVSLPEVTRASRNYISIMVNGRFIKNYPIVNAIMEGYHTLLPINRYPIVLLMIEMDPVLVDVNVHPTKLTVRISKEAELSELIVETLKKTFRKQVFIPSGTTGTREKQYSEQTELKLENKSPSKPLLNSEADSNGFNKEKTKYTLNIIKQDLPENNGAIVNEPVIDKTIDQINPVIQKKPTPNMPEKNPEPLEDAQSDRIPPMYPIGQLHGTYILAQNEQGLYMIDQHAAQERIKYEYFREKVGQVEKELQELLVPITLEFSSDECIKIQEHRDKLEQVGIFLEEFGLNSFIIKAHPRWFPRGYEKETIEEIIEQLLTMKKIDIKALLEEAAIMMSCKGSIKANHYLRQDEIQALLDELRRAEDPFTCPHGRPIIIHFSTYEIEKMFKRVM